jgi:hypothetical protein
MKRKSNACFALVLAVSLNLFGSGCINPAPSDGDLEYKSEYSVLQFYEYEFRSKDHAVAYVLHKNALNSGLDVVGFPVAGRDVGYVWIVAKTNKDGMILQIPERAEFLVDEGALVALKKEINFSPSVLKVLESKAKEPLNNSPGERQ